MSFTRINGVLHAEQCSLQQLAEQFGTPLYVYSKATFEKHFLDMDRAFDFIDHQICFAVKSNSNLAVLNVLAKLGAGFDIVTGGELARVLAAGGDPAHAARQARRSGVDRLLRNAACHARGSAGARRTRSRPARHAARKGRAEALGLCPQRGAGYR